MLKPLTRPICTPATAHVQHFNFSCQHVLSASAMNRRLSPNSVRPNLPLRKPFSSPVALPGETFNAIRDCSSPLSRDKSALLGSTPPALTVYLCNFCGQQGNFRCKRCKKTPYCSVVCQTEDWKAHRHMCKSIDLEPVKAKPKDITVSSVTGDRGSLLKHGDASSPQRVYLKDLHTTKIIKGTDIQASVVEFYSPGRFFLLAQIPELLEALQSISTELQKTYSCPTLSTYVPNVGEICAVQFSFDLNWYRGLVQNLTADHKMANILYIDFGNEEEVSLGKIRPLATSIQPFCPCAMECRIAGVVPVAGKWSGECCFAVTQMLAGKTVSVRLVESVENHIHLVDILLSMGKQLSTFLIEHGYAAKETANVTPTEQEIDAMMSASLENFRRLSSGKDDNTWAQPPKPLTQAVGDSFSAVVTHFQSPTDIVVQKVENAGVIQELQLKLREHCCQVSSPQNFRPAPGTVCCAQFSEDKQWYRANVLAYSSEERVCVGYLDFGNSEEVDLGHLRPISTALLALPMQAMPCGLAGVQPTGGRWSDDCLLALQRRVSNRILRIEIQGAHEGKVLVAMVDEASDPQANVAELLISAGFGVPAPVANSSAAIKSQVLPPNSEPLVWSCTELSRDGQTVALLASVLKNPGEFYCHMDNPTVHQKLIELGNELKQHCEADATPFDPKVGEPCCAMFSGNGAWYRAVVKELSDNVAFVSFVDYGYTMNVKKSHLRSITPQLLTLPFQAVHCWLTGVEPLGLEWSREALLCFQTLVDGEQLSARVLSVTTQGYGVELESRGQNVAAVLISQQLAKVPGEIFKETHAITDSEDEHQKTSKENKHSQIHGQAFSQTAARSKDVPTEGGAAAPSEVSSFPVDWKTMELPLNETFQPFIAAVTSPSLFYLLVPSQVDQQKLQGVMMEVAAFCTNNQASLSSATLSRPASGAACCAQFTADNNWYRAVVLEAGESEISVIYADYGNTEKVPFSRILPIPGQMLQLPFQISRCTLTGKEHFPAEWPEGVQQMFRSVLMKDVLATVHSFDGSANVLSLTLPSESSCGDVTAMILDALQAQSESSSCCPATTQKTDQTDSCTLAPSPRAVPDCPQTKSMPGSQKVLQNGTATSDTTTTPESTLAAAQQNKNTSTASVSDNQAERIIEQMEPVSQTNTEPKHPQTCSCCCESLKTKIDHLEQLMQLQLSLIKHLVGQTK
ncbi:Tudor domain-containing protein 1 [Channa argus]|uniref:Tudor domain-containing protein 1 n=1 Tax=Channa argus TaxID=215402 RepID=A0A6G1QP78_CHAAH|nr:Tudor domain-containing protein 1 [Channa argus]